MRITWMLTLFLTLACGQSLAKEWYLNEKIIWMVVNYSAKTCDPAVDFGKEMNPIYLIEKGQCMYVTDDSMVDHIAMIDCGEKFDAYFYFTTSIEACGAVIEAIKEIEQEQSKTLDVEK